MGQIFSTVINKRGFMRKFTKFQLFIKSNSGTINNRLEVCFDQKIVKLILKKTL